MKKERLQILQARINQQAMEISRAMVGTTQRVLVEKLSKKSDARYRGAPKTIVGSISMPIRRYRAVC